MITYIEPTKKLFTMYRQMAEKAMAQVSDEELLWLPNGESNSIAIIVKHMAGNMHSRWTDFLTTDGEKPWRNRDGEFEDAAPSRPQLMQQWNDGWDCVFNTLGQLTDADLDKIVYIRNEGHTVLDAINRQIAHYASHIGQIVYIAKMRRDKDWQSLSIPRNKTAEYNAAKFAQEKAIKTFTDDFIK